MKARWLVSTYMGVLLIAFPHISRGDEPHVPEVSINLRHLPSQFSDLKLPEVPTPADVQPSETRSGFSTSLQTMVLFAVISLAPVAVLMVTAFVRISIVLTLLRQALGNPQVPGNQVLTALALLLTALVMRPIAEAVYENGIKPYSEKKLDVKSAWESGSAPVKAFMIEQLCRTHHEYYLTELYAHTRPAREVEAVPTECEQFSLAIIAPAYLLSELTTALYIGFAIYLPFLVIDLVVSAVLSAMGLFMMPPSLVSLPLKLVLFVLADGWMLVAGMLLRSFSATG